jgi:uncharacterized caspase-like protein
LAFVIFFNFLLASFGQKQYSLEKLEKMQEYQKHGKKLQRLIFLIKTAGHIFGERQKTQIQKLKLSKPTKPFDFTAFTACKPSRPDAKIH